MVGFCAFLPSSTFSDITSVVWKWPRWKYWHHRNWQILQISGFLNLLFHWWVFEKLWSVKDSSPGLFLYIQRVRHFFFKGCNSKQTATTTTNTQKRTYGHRHKWSTKSKIFTIFSFLLKMFLDIWLIPSRVMEKVLIIQGNLKAFRVFSSYAVNSTENGRNSIWGFKTCFAIQQRSLSALAIEGSFEICVCCFTFILLIRVNKNINQHSCWNFTYSSVATIDYGDCNSAKINRSIFFFEKQVAIYNRLLHILLFLVLHSSTI